MKTSKLNHIALLGVFILAVSLVGGGCASKKEIWGNPKTGLVLRYKAPENNTMSYSKTMDFRQRMDINGQQVSVDAIQDLSYSMSPGKSNDHMMHYLITIDSADYAISSPRGELNPDLSSIIGESFGMDVSSMGYEKIDEQAKNIKYSLEGEEQSVASNFSSLFPELPEHPVKIGDTWSSVDSIVEENSRGDLLLIFNNFHTLVSIEKFRGLDCVKVETKIVGTMNAGGKEEDVVYSYDGDMTGSGTWYFAYKEGMLVQETGEGTGSGNIKIPSRDMSIPMTREFRVEHTLLQ